MPMLANERKLAASTHKQALSALLFLYREVVDIDLPWLTDISRLSRPRPDTALAGHLLYGTGMRLMEGLRLPVKDVSVVEASRGRHKHLHCQNPR